MWQLSYSVFIVAALNYIYVCVVRVYCLINHIFPGYFLQEDSYSQDIIYTFCLRPFHDLIQS